MYISLTACTEALYNQAREFFLKQWRSDFLSKTKNSLIWRYLVNQYMLDNWKPWFSFEEWIYSYQDLYFSTSYSNDIIAVLIDNKKVAIDIEHLVNRDESLLKDLKILDDSLTEWENFYIQWCWKECLFKYLDLNIHESMNDMSVISIQQENKKINDINFWLELSISYRWNVYKIDVSVNDDTVLAIMS